jgi:riboflavin kinase/FMN adenylyltransferase
VELIRGRHNLRAEHRGCVLTIGNFDGVHRGHQTVLGQLGAVARSYQLPSLLITFEPHPQEHFVPGRAPPRLTRFKEKMVALRAMPIDRVLCLRFDRTLARVKAGAFIEDLLVGALGARHVVVGSDFRFGRDRCGDILLLEQAGRQFGFAVAPMETCSIDGRRVSSTWVRTALEGGDFATARELLGRPFRLCGKVVAGDGRGRELGFPTANIFLHRKSVPLSGVHVVRACGIADRPLPGVANIGTRPTVDRTRSSPLLEVHLLDFAQDLYGREVEVEFLSRLRAEQRFESLEALTTQIVRDTEKARAYFAIHS